LPAIKPGDARADGFARERGNIHKFAATGGIENRRDDFAVAGAAAEHTAERILHVLFGWFTTPIQQRDGGYQHSGRADAALGRAMGGKAALEARRFWAVRVQSLDGGDRPALGLGGADEAGANWRAIEQHGTGAAIAGIAADLCALQLQRLAQHMAQPVAGPRRDLNGFAVHGHFQSAAHAKSLAAQSSRARTIRWRAAPMR